LSIIIYSQIKSLVILVCDRDDFFFTDDNENDAL